MSLSNANHYWVLRLEGDLRQVNLLARKLGAPDTFRPASILPMPMSVVRLGLRDAQVWRVNHWGLNKEPRKIRWHCQKEEQAYTLVAEGGFGVPISLVKQASLEYKRVKLHLVWKSPYGAQHGQTWFAGNAFDVPQSSQDRMLSKAFDLGPLPLDVE